MGHVQHTHKEKMGKLFWILLLGFCLLTVRATEDKEEDDAADDAAEEGADAGSGSDDEAEAEEAGDAAEEGETKEFQCNLKFKRIGCYADKGKKDKPLVSFMESDEDLSVNAKRGKIKGSLDKFNGELPKFACKCANDAINSGNAIFGLQNLAECWSGPTTPNTTKTVHPRTASPSIWPSAKTATKCVPARSTPTSCTTSTPQNTPRPPTK